MATDGFAQVKFDRHSKITYSKRYFSRDKPTATMFNINNISGWISWNGMSGHDPIVDDAGVWYPRGTAPVVFTDGLLWGGYVQDPDTIKPRLRVGGQHYITGTIPGWINSPGNPQPPDDPRVRIYRIRRDWQTVTDEELWQEAAELLHLNPAEITQQQIVQLRAQYQTDWNEWPVEVGAPFYDLNGNGIYEPSQGETPGLQNADQVIWLVVNDLDFASVFYIFGSPPIGLELQTTIWAYNRLHDPLGQVVFRSYRLINKSEMQIDSMFVGVFSDLDIGDYTDDFLGCDTSLQLGYAYNAFMRDNIFSQFNLPPSAVGYQLLQGPVVPSPGDTANFDFKRKPDYRNLPLNSFVPFQSVNSPDPPPIGDYTMTSRFYNGLNGYQFDENTLNPPPFTIGSGPERGFPTKFKFTGDPLLGTGDVDGIEDNFLPGDRRILMSSGPFTMLPGDTQELVVALVGGNDLVSDNLGAVQDLKYNCEMIRRAWEKNFRAPCQTEAPVQPAGDQFQLTSKINLSDFPEATACRVQLNAQYGSEPEIMLPLYDDGTGGDETAGDFIWSRTVLLDSRKYPLKGDLVIDTPAGQIEYPAAVGQMTLRPAPVLNNWQLTWENGKQDGEINEGEKVHVAFDIRNIDSQNRIDHLKIVYQTGQRSQLKYIAPAPIEAGATVQHPEQYIQFTAPAGSDSISIPITINYDYNRTRGKLHLPVTRWYPDTIRGKDLAVETVRGFAENVHPIVADPTLLTGHRYQITFRADTVRDSLTWKLRDLTTQSVKAENQVVGESLDEDYPVIDGIEWKIFSPTPALRAIVEISNSGGPLDENNWDGRGAPFRGNFVWHSLSAPGDSNRWFLSSGNSLSQSLDRVFQIHPQIADHDFEIRFSRQQRSLYLHWNGNDSVETVPFSAWDVGTATYRDSSDDVRLLPGGGNVGTGFDNFAANIDPWSGFPASD
ncbi:MAG TPA: hypothetical protein ENK14_10165, partial [Caldithrix sp.]|nr:hypothetical protein [Caldithrix sp.]